MKKRAVTRTAIMMAIDGLNFAYGYGSVGVTGVPDWALMDGTKRRDRMRTA